jgi:hypothetical protein
MHNETTGKRAADVGGKSRGTGKPGWFGLQFGHDPINRELRVCMTRAVAGVSVAGFCGLLIGVVALSRNASNNGPQSARASIIEPAAEEGLPKVAPPARPARPKPAQVHTSAKPVVAVNTPIKTPAPITPAAVLAKPRSGAMPTTSVTPDSLNKDFAAPATRVAPLAAAPAVAAPVAAAPAAPEGRTAGHNYLVFGSFPTMNEAKRISQKLRSDGVNCTIERGLPGWTKKSWYSVVGVKGYETTKNAAYQTDLKSMEHLGLEPRAYRWRNTGA